MIDKSKNYSHNDWLYFSWRKPLSEDLVKEFKGLVCWDYISEYQNLSEDFIREFQDKVLWYNISNSQKLSEEFIREFRDKVYWNFIGIYQNLSEDFIREFQDKVDWTDISKYQKLSKGFIEEFKLTIPRHSRMYWTVEQKKEYIKFNYPEYEIIENKITAYKSTRPDGYSVYNFQYHYEVGKEYERHADCNSDNIDSFGLSAWTKKGAINYYGCGKLFKVEIDLEDLACIIDYEGKIRASKIKILEEIPKEDWYK